MEFSQADYPHWRGQQGFIAELMPKFPLYTCFLPRMRGNVIGKVHPTPSRRWHAQSEGSVIRGYVDIFDAGPAIEAQTAKIRAVQNSEVAGTRHRHAGDDATHFLIHNRKREDCRITVAPARLAAGTLVVDATAKRLQLWRAIKVRSGLRSRLGWLRATECEIMCSLLIRRRAGWLHQGVIKQDEHASPVPGTRAVEALESLNPSQGAIWHGLPALRRLTLPYRPPVPFPSLGPRSLDERIAVLEQFAATSKKG